MLSVVTHLAMLAGLLFGTVTDLRTREVPDWLNFSLIASGLGLGVIASLVQVSWQPVLTSLAGLILGVFIGYVMFYAGQWGGGDAKLIMGLGALFGLSFASSWSWTSLPPLVVFLVNTLLVGAVYGLGWAAAMVVIHWGEVREALKGFLGTPRAKLFRKAVLVLVALAVAAALLTGGVIGLVWLVLGAAIFLTFYLWALIQVVEKTCMVRPKRTSALTEGDWVNVEVRAPRKYRSLASDLVERQEEEFEEKNEYDFFLGWFRQLGLARFAERREERLRRKTVKSAARVVRDVASSYERFAKRKLPQGLRKELGEAFAGSEKSLEAVEKACVKHGLPSLLGFLEKKYSYRPREKHLAGPGDLGISRRQIAALRHAGVKRVAVKEGIPFVPSFLVAYLVTILWGNWFVLLF
ncbi:A24 family peptidase [Candidatus Woesearchaeota archaeon]|nr:A24 family peptidase [Candidatus Woesearchaeota archaeon]